MTGHALKAELAILIAKMTRTPVPLMLPPGAGLMPSRKVDAMRAKRKAQRKARRVQRAHR